MSGRLFDADGRQYRQIFPAEVELACWRQACLARLWALQTSGTLMGLPNGDGLLDRPDDGVHLSNLGQQDLELARSRHVLVSVPLCRAQCLSVVWSSMCQQGEVQLNLLYPALPAFKSQ